MRIIWSNKSLADIENIFNYIKLDNKKKAGEFILEIREKINLLKDFPEIGKCSALFNENNNIREFVLHKNYLVSYKVKKEEIQVLQVWQARKGM